MTFAKLRGPRMVSLSTGWALSSETWIVTGRPRSFSILASSREVNSVAFESTSTGSRRASCSSRSGSQGIRKGSPPVMPSSVKPSPTASSASASMTSGSRPRRSTAGPDSVRQ